MTPTSEIDPPSPCVKICILDAAGRTCLGCRRMIEEIAGWSRMSGDDKRRVLSLITRLG
jgi:predicted Fe-S protein YdhL (DUF1289 family)